MRVVELMKRRCRRVLEWAAALTVTVTIFHCILQSITPPSRLQPSKKLQIIECVTWEIERLGP